ncbi:MAG TPA: PrsW family intramembrane metalloprotease [Thermoanaerobaculia bacterium]
MIFLLALLLSFGPALACAAAVYWLDRYEKEPAVLLGAVFGWGAVVAIAGALLAQFALEGATALATGSRQAADFAGTTLFAPFTEETLKGVAVLVVFVVVRHELDSVLDGIVYAAVTALGFAATEDFFYLLGAGVGQGVHGLLGLFVLRVVLGIWDHPFYTSFIGIGLAVSRLSRSLPVRWLAPPAGWAAALGFHALHNTLATFSEKVPALGAVMFFLDWSGWLLMGLLILLAIRREARLVGVHLAEEVESGRLTLAQYRTAVSRWGRSGACLRAMTRGRLRTTSRFYQVCGELAHKKEQLASLGDEGCNTALVEELRTELAGLSGEAVE